MNPSLLLYVLSVVVASFSQILLKKSAMKTYDSFIKEYVNPYVICGYIMLFGSMLLTILAFRGLDYKYGPIIESLGYVLVLILSRLIFKEGISRRKLLGVVLILAGILVFNLGA
ncbi:MAG: multidrug ABC transporter [Lachnospiraceae bacterium]|nr:multidrug ABC transporter [Lachnospiraceae bacterium]